MTFSPIRWQNNSLELLDQRILPHKEKWIKYSNPIKAAEAITNMVVRGAPAIGITASYVMALSALQHKNKTNIKNLIFANLQIIKKSRPTAYNLFWALSQYQKLIDENNFNFADYLYLAKKIHKQDIENNIKMGDFGNEYIKDNDGILTHCNAGALATGGYGTALGVIRAAHRDKKIKKVYADETRPWLQGTRLTAWELLKDNISTTIITDSSAAVLMAQNKIQWVVVGADRITANGDVINKIGTYSLAILANFHKIGFMVVAPTSTIDKNIKKGEDIIIEHRHKNEVLFLNEQNLAPDKADAINQVFDTTPANLISVIITEKKAIENPNFKKINGL
ncbi:MAG: S-methyl-5-thioribose-1-phosphate isomerase [Gammaproteobacteria bacterium]|nr:MAG: S-methyl-5-thioribose-1-phosphate isomerase [Gammaproteobacteria bacterium]